MDVMEPISPSTALSSFPVKVARVTKASSSSSMSTDRGSTRASSFSISETSKRLLRESFTPLERSATNSLDEKRWGDSNQDHKVKRYKSSDLLKLETDRESVINLAKFLRTTNPPPNNYMSMPESTQQQILDKKLPFKLLRRQASKKSSDNAVRTLRLPDSAVAAKTSKGHWHIAISIPVEYDHQGPNTPTQNQITKHAKTQSETAIGNGPITVLKPMIGNVRPAAMERVHMKSHSHDDLRRTLGIARPPPLPLLPDGKAGPILPAICDRSAAEDICSTVKAEGIQSSHPFHTNDIVLTGDTSRPESQRSHMRKSEDTDCTIQSLDSSMCHTRDQSSISTAASTKHPTLPLSVWPHQSQKSGASDVLDQSGHSTSAQSLQSVADNRTDDSIRPHSVGSDMSSANLKVAATAQGYGPDMPGTQVVFVRKGIQTPSYRARIARRPPKNSSAEYILSSQSGHSQAYSAVTQNSVDLGGTTKARQSRRERVKAIRSRDMAKLRALKKYQQVMASVTGQEIPIASSLPQPNGQLTKPYQYQKQKRSLSHTSIAEETSWQESLNSLTPIMVTVDLEPSNVSPEIRIHPTMLVANLEPSEATPALFVPVSRLSMQNVKKKEARSTRNSQNEAQTPPCSNPPSPTLSNGEERTTRGSLDPGNNLPRSTGTSPASSGTETVQSLRSHPSTSSSYNSQNSSDASKYKPHSRRQESIPDESMDLRMRRLETVNAVIFRTLNAVVEMGMGFRELRQLLPTDSTGPDEAQFRKGYGGRGDEEQDPVGSLIRELRGAVKIGQEELAKYGAAV